jgi:hypothetical protein
MLAGDVRKRRRLTSEVQPKSSLRIRPCAQVFFVKREHQPCGLISPSTSLQAFGGWKLLHPSHRSAPFGIPWYATVF